MDAKYKNIELYRIENEALEKAKKLVVKFLRGYEIDKKIDPQALKWSKQLARTICDEVISELKSNHSSDVESIERLNFWVITKQQIKNV